MRLCRIQIIAFIIILIACFILLYLFRGYLQFLSVFVADPLWATVLVTVVLVTINALYAWQTRQVIHEMEKARKAEFIPHLRAELAWMGPVHLVLKFTNFGKGPAKDVEAEITFEPSKEKRSWRQAIMAPNEFIRVFLPEGNIEKVCEKSAIVIVKGEYKDLFGQVLKIDETMNVQDFIKQAKQLSQLVEPELDREVRNIKDELKKISAEIRNLRRQRARALTS